MPTITRLAVSSSLVIRFRWEAAAGETLSGVDFPNSSITGPGVDPPNGSNLGNWQQAQTMELVAGSVYDMVLTPGGADAGFALQTGEVVTIEFHFLAGGAAPAQAAAIVDAPYDQVINSISGPTGIRQGISYLTGFPFQVYDGISAPPGGGGAATGAPTARAMVDAQMRAILGRSTGSGGVAGTLAALDRSFTMDQQRGVDVWVWQPRSYAVQSDIGAGVTGRQASIARLAGTIADEITPLVDGLTPLVPEDSVNPDEIDAARSIFDESLPAFVTEIGLDGGPRITRALGLLQDVATQLQALGMLLGALGEHPRGGGVDLSDPTTWVRPRRLLAPGIGFPWDALDPQTWWPPDERYVVTVADEQDLTDYRIAFDRLSVLVAQFQAGYMAGGLPGAQPQDRGMLIVLLQRALDASAEAAQATQDALDSVNLGPDEREVIYLDATGLSVDDALTWATSFPSDEAPPLLQDGGRLGARSILARTQAIVASVNLIQNPQNAPSPLPDGLSHPRVVYALRLLADALGDVVNAARPLT